MISKFLLFKKNDDEQFILGPKGFNNNPAYSLNTLTIWKFHNNDSQAFLLVSGKDLLATFTSSEELLNVLSTEKVPVKEIRILNDEINYNNAVFTCENGIIMRFRAGESLCISFSVTNGGDAIISHDFLCDSPLNTSQKIDTVIAGMFTENYSFVSETNPDDNGTTPAWISDIIQGKVTQNVKEGSKTLKVIGVVIAIIILAWLTRYLL